MCKLSNSHIFLLLLLIIINVYSQANSDVNYTIDDFDEKTNTTKINLDLFNIVKIAINENSNSSNYILKQHDFEVRDTEGTDFNNNSHDDKVEVFPNTPLNEEDSLVNPIYSVQYLDHNATVWDLLVAQFQADFKPFLILIPKPIQTYVLKLFEDTRLSMGSTLQGALRPMLSTLAIVGLHVGKILVQFGSKLIEICA